MLTPSRCDICTSSSLNARHRIDGSGPRQSTTSRPARPATNSIDGPADLARRAVDEVDGRTCLLEVDELGEIDPAETRRRFELLAQDRGRAGAGEAGVDPARERDDEHRVAQFGPPIDLQHITTLLPPSRAPALLRRSARRRLLVTGVRSRARPARRFWLHALAHLHRAAAGRDVRPAARGRPHRGGARLRRLLPLRPLPAHGRRRPRPRARPTRGSRSPASRARRQRVRLGTLVTSQHLPAARAAGDRRGAGRRHERRAGRARHRRRLVRRRASRLRHPVPADAGAVRPARGAARDHHRPVDDARRASGSRTAGATTSSPTPRRCRSRCSSPTRRSSSAATAPSARRRSRRATRRSSTCRSRRSTCTASPSTGCSRRARTRDATRRRCAPRSRCVVCCGRDEAEFRRRADAIGREPDELRANGAAGLPGEVVDKLHAFAAAGAETAYLQVLDVSDLDHLELLAAEVMPEVGATAGAA